MAEIFPPNLPQCFQIEGFAYQNIANTIRSEVEVGIPKVRRRYTVAYGQATGSLVLTKSELRDFLAFYHTILTGGVRRFSFKDPITDTVRDFRFIEAPLITPIGATHWRAALQLEVLS